MRRGLKTVCLAASILLAGSSAFAQDQRPNWDTPPDPELLQAAVPPIARALGMEGRVTLQCRTNLTGGVDSCTVLSETPKNVGFGEGALRVSKYFRFKPALSGGKLVQGTVRIPLVLKVEEEEPPAAPAAAAPSRPVTEEALQLARRLLKAEGAFDPARALQALETEWSHGGLEPAQAQALKILSEGPVNAMVAAAAERHARVYAAALSVDALRKAAEFAESPAGKEFNAAWPQVWAGLQVLEREYTDQVKAALRAKLCEPDDCSPSE